MVKLNLTGLQSADTQDTPVGEQIPEATEATQTTPETPVIEEANYSFSLSSLIGNPIESNTKQETTTNLEASTLSAETVINTPAEEGTSLIKTANEEQSILNISGITGGHTNTNEEIISINDINEDGESQDVVKSEAITTQTPLVEEETKEFFKGFDVIREFSEEKGDEIVISKGETKIIASEETKKDELESISIIPEENQSIIEENKEVAEITVTQSEELLASSQVTSDTQVSASILTTQEENTVGTTNGESISINETTNMAINEDISSVIQPTADVEQAKKDLSATRKPFGIKSFSKKSVIVSLGAVFIVGLATFGISQFDILGGKANLQEVPPMIKYVSGTDYTVIANKNKRKNIRKPREAMPINVGAEIGTGEQLSSTGMLLENSGSSTMSGIINTSGAVNEQVPSPSTEIIPPTGQGPNQEPNELGSQQLPQGSNTTNSGIPSTPQSNTSANDMNDIANGVN